jgi:hypothetical protein
LLFPVFDDHLGFSEHLVHASLSFRLVISMLSSFSVCFSSSFGSFRSFCLFYSIVIQSSISLGMTIRKTMSVNDCGSFFISLSA